MIRVNRAAVPPPEILTDVKRAGPKETARAIGFYVKKQGKAPNFAAYKEPEVKAALEKLFQKKCAYCESSYQAVMPFPVEHWRPKGRVTLDDGTKAPGYFWLAAHWENLFVSCNDCNGEREHLDVLTGTSGVMGKLDRFPLTDETKRATAPGKEIDEAPLLLNPCIDDPAQHLEFFDPVGERAVLRPKGGSVRGERSIEVYALNRIGLVRERQELANQITLLKSQVDKNLKALDVGAGAAEALVRENVTDALVALVEMRAPGSRYSAFARQEIDGFLGPLLQKFGLPPLPA